MPSVASLLANCDGNASMKPFFATSSSSAVTGWSCMRLNSSRMILIASATVGFFDSKAPAKVEG